MTSGGAKGKSGGVGVVTVGDSHKKPAKEKALGPFKFTHAQFEKVRTLDPALSAEYASAAHRTASSLRPTCLRTGGATSSS
jgi:hypothetical protein